ncbi:MAG: flagellar hook-basal body complex protein FliE [Nitrospiria bacterium]
MAIQPIGPKTINGPAGIRPEAATKGEKPFLETLKKSIDETNALQLRADQAVADLATGKTQDLHQTMIAIEKADVSFQLMMQVRNKILSAYEEITRMQI